LGVQRGGARVTVRNAFLDLERKGMAQVTVEVGDRKPGPVLHNTTPTTPAVLGWDPIEVWRTRVLLPRLTAEQRDEKVAPRAPLVQLVRP
jgi:hypothetical protein